MKLSRTIEANCRYIRLPAIKNNYKSISEEARKKNLSYEDFLCLLLEQERESRFINRAKSRLRLAKFPQKKYLEDLQLEFLPKEASSRLNEFRSLDFMKSGKNLILIGNSGTGKTHLAIGLGIEACQKGYKVLYTSIYNLVIKLKESKIQKKLRQTANQFKKYDLVICDELGYVSLDKEEAELLFSNLSLRADNKSLIIISNRSLERWNDIFHDPIMAATIIDRLCYNSYMIDMTQDSYRARFMKNRTEAQV